MILPAGKQVGTRSVKAHATALALTSAGARTPSPSSGVPAVISGAGT
jgi:hypothetical protein